MRTSPGRDASWVKHSNREALCGLRGEKEMREGGAYATGVLPGCSLRPTREVVSHEAKGTFQAMKSGEHTPAAKRNIIVYIATSAGGYIARPDGSVDWLNRPMPKDGYGMTAFARSIDTILWGRKTYDFAAKMGGSQRLWQSQTLCVFPPTSLKSAAGSRVCFRVDPGTSWASSGRCEARTYG